MDFADDGRFEVRLEQNDHLVLAYGCATETSKFPPLPGERVKIELLDDDLRGWRIARRP